MKHSLFSDREEIISDIAFDFTVTLDCGGEVTMPDYYPKIKRIVSVSAEALPDSRFLSENSLEYGGTVAFSVLYIGDDGAIHSVPYSTEYTGNAEIPSAPLGSAGIFIDTVAESPHCRVLAPRRISLKTRLRTEISSDSNEIYKCRVTAKNGAEMPGGGISSLETMERCYSTLKRGRAYATGSVSGELRDTAGTPVSCKGAVDIVSVTSFNDTVSVTGNIIISGIVFTPDGKYETYREKLPFEETLSADGMTEGAKATAWGKVASVSVEADEDDGTLHAEAEYDLVGYWCLGESVTVTADAYSTKYDYETKRTDFGVISPVCTKYGNLTVTGEEAVTDKDGGRGDIIDVAAFPKFEKADIKDGKLTFSGSCKFKVYSADNGDISADEIDIPLKYDIPADSPETSGDILSSELVWHIIPTVTDASARQNDGKLTVRAELSLSCDAVRRMHISPITEISLGDEAEKEKNCEVLRICYPEKGVPVWELAKNKRADIAELERINGIKSDSMSDGTPLILR